MWEHINKQPKKQTYIKDLIRKDMGLIPPKGYKFDEEGNLVIDWDMYQTLHREIRKYLRGAPTTVKPIEPIIDEKTFAEVQEKLNNKKK